MRLINSRFRASIFTFSNSFKARPVTVSRPKIGGPIEQSGGINRAFPESPFGPPGGLQGECFLRGA
jgi:hypothetical protein